LNSVFLDNRDVLTERIKDLENANSKCIGYFLTNHLTSGNVFFDESNAGGTSFNSQQVIAGIIAPGPVLFFILVLYR
tara:strand:+ start:310 stop:540 length:231 start_codon:yes stop_codon:yes gene_type:complete